MQFEVKQGEFRVISVSPTNAQIDINISNAEKREAIIKLAMRDFSEPTQKPHKFLPKGAKKWTDTEDQLLIKLFSGSDGEISHDEIEDTAEKLDRTSHAILCRLYKLNLKGKQVKTRLARVRA